MTFEPSTLLAEKLAGRHDLAGSLPKSELAEVVEPKAESARLTLTIGARFACFFCRDRTVHAERCKRCGRKRIELIGNAANSRLVQLARRVKAASPTGGAAKRARDGVLHSVAHSVAMIFAAVGGFLAQHLPHAHGESQFFVTMLGILLGAVAGYLAVALALVLFLLAGGAVALCIALVFVAVFGVLRFCTMPLGSRGSGVRKSLDKTLQLWLSAVFRPVFVLHGIWSRTRWSQKQKHEALTPIAPTLATNNTTSITGIITECQSLAGKPLPNTVAVGLMGDTVGTWVQDAVIAPFTLTTSSGEKLQVVVNAGELSVYTQEAQSEEPPLSEELTPYGTQFGIAKAKRKPELIPPAKSLKLWRLSVGRTVRIEGGVERQQMSNTAESGYRESAFTRVLHGDAEHPIRVTVLVG